MIYLDYAANTPADRRVLEEYLRLETALIGNANSHHQAGRTALAQMDQAVHQVADVLSAKPGEVIFTSGASESNNLALKGLTRMMRHTGRHIISTALEHSSVSGCLTALQEQGYEIDLVDIRRDGTVDLEHLRELLRQDTVMVVVSAVDSELGTIQPVDKIVKILKGYPNCHLHVDATQAIGKIPFSFSGIDTMSFTAHKFYGLRRAGNRAADSRRSQHHDLPQRNACGSAGIVFSICAEHGAGGNDCPDRGGPAVEPDAEKGIGTVSGCGHQQSGDSGAAHSESQCTGDPGRCVSKGAG